MKAKKEKKRKKEEKKSKSRKKSELTRPPSSIALKIGLGLAFPTRSDKLDSPGPPSLSGDLDEMSQRSHLMSPWSSPGSELATTSPVKAKKKLRKKDSKAKKKRSKRDRSKSREVSKRRSRFRSRPTPRNRSRSCEEPSLRPRSKSPYDSMPYKTKPCWNFANGNCPYGSQCRFMHEEESKEVNKREKTPDRR